MNNLFTFDDCQISSNDFILLDTSFLLAFCGFDTYGKKNVKNEDIERRHECENLINKVAAANAMFAISIKTYEEMCDVVIRNTFRNSGYNKEEDIKKLKHENLMRYRKLMGQANNDIDDYLRGLAKSEYFYNEYIGSADGSLISKARNIQISFDIHGLSDAMQVAIAQEEGLTHLAAVDRDFSGVIDNDLTILVDTKTYNKL